MPHTLQRTAVHVVGRMPSDNPRKKVNYIMTTKRAYRTADNWFRRNLDFILASLTAMLGVLTYGFQSVANELLERPVTSTDYTASGIAQVAADVCFIGAIISLGVLVYYVFRTIRKKDAD